MPTVSRLRHLVFCLLPLLLAASQAEGMAKEPARLRPVPQQVRGAPVLLAMDMSAGVPVVHVLIGETRLRLVVDTGANWCILSPEAAERAGLATRRSADLQVRDAAGNQIAVEAAHISSLVLPGLEEGEALELRGLDVILLDSPSAARAGADGVLGLPLFQRLVGRFDFPAGELRLGGEALGEGPGVLPLRITAARPAIEARFEQLEEPQPLLIDTGLSSPLHLSPELAEKLATPQPPQATGQSSTALGEHEIQQVQLQGALSLGEHRIPAPAATALTEGGGSAMPAIGCGILRDFVLTLDLPRRRVRLERVDPEPRPASAAPAAGSAR